MHINSLWPFGVEVMLRISTYMRLETDPPDTFEGPSMWSLLWRGAEYLLFDLLDYPPSHGKETASSRMVVEKIPTLYMSRRPLATCGGPHACYHQNRRRPSGPVHTYNMKDRMASIVWRRVGGEEWSSCCSHCGFCT